MEEDRRRFFQKSSQLAAGAFAVGALAASTSEAQAPVKPIGWPPLSEMMEKIVVKHIPVFS